MNAADVLGDSIIPELLDRIYPVRPERVQVVPAPIAMRKSWGPATGAMTLGTRVFVDPDILRQGGRRLIDLIIHELVHVRQWMERTRTSFLLGYVRQYLLARMRGASHNIAYRSIDAEVEARQVASEIRNLLDEQSVSGDG